MFFFKKFSVNYEIFPKLQFRGRPAGLLVCRRQLNGGLPEKGGLSPGAKQICPNSRV
jgi:hypothetical protein